MYVCMYVCVCVYARLCICKCRGTSRIKEAKSRKSRSWIHGWCICGLITAETSPNWNICMISGTITMYIQYLIAWNEEKYVITSLDCSFR